MERPYVWQMIKEALEALGGKTTYTAIRQYIHDKYGDVNDSSITCTTIVCCVNHPSRVHYFENKKPRKAEAKYDFLFHSGRGTTPQGPGLPYHVWLTWDGGSVDSNEGDSGVIYSPAAAQSNPKYGGVQPDPIKLSPCDYDIDGFKKCLSDEAGRENGQRNSPPILCDNYVDYLISKCMAKNRACGKN